MPTSPGDRRAPSTPVAWTVPGVGLNAALSTMAVTAAVDHRAALVTGTPIVGVPAPLRVSAHYSVFVTVSLSAFCVIDFAMPEKTKP